MFVTVRHIESIVVELALQLVPPAVALGKFHNMAKSFLKTPFIQKENSNFDAPPFSQDTLIITNYCKKDVS